MNWWQVSYRWRARWLVGGPSVSLSSLLWGGFWGEAITIISCIFPYHSIRLFKFHSQCLSYWSVSITVDSNCNTGIMTHCKVDAAGSDTCVIRHVDFEQFCILPLYWRKNKKAPLISCIFRRNDILLKISEKLEKIQSNKKIDWLQEEKKTRSKSVKIGK